MIHELFTNTVLNAKPTQEHGDLWESSSVNLLTVSSYRLSESNKSNCVRDCTTNWEYIRVSVKIVISIITRTT